MYCAKCGQEMPDDAVFCGECGTKVEKEQPMIFETEIIQPYPPMPVGSYTQEAPTPATSAAPASPKSKLGKSVFIAVIILALMVTCFTMVGKQLYSPETVAKRYFMDMVNADWNSVYEELDVHEAKFLSKQEFVNAKQNTKKKAINNFQMKKITNTKDTMSESVKINYRIKGELDNREETIKLTKQDKKAFLLFPRWKVNPESHVAREIQIRVPEKAKVFLEKKELASSYLIKSDNDRDDMDIYKIPAMFKGSFNLKIEKEFMETTNTSFKSQEGYMLNEMVLSSDLKEKITKMSAEFINQLYTNAAKQAPYMEIEKLFEKENKNFTPENMYKGLSEKFDSKKNSFIDKIDFSDVAGNISYRMNDKKMYVMVDLKASYKIAYYQSGWFTSELKLYEDSGNSSMYLTYVYNDDSWVISDVNPFRIYY